MEENNEEVKRPRGRPKKVKPKLGRPKKSELEKEMDAIRKDKEPILICHACGNTKVNAFYQSTNIMHRRFKKYPICKDCLNLESERFFKKHSDQKLAFFNFCKKFDIYFSLSAFEGAVKQSLNAGENWSVCQAYMKQINSFKESNNYGDCFEDTSDVVDKLVISRNKIENGVVKSESFEDWSIDENRNMQDVIKILGYDPFEFESLSDRRKMYTKLVDYLDESTQEDSFKLPVVVQIVTNFNQAEKLDKTIAEISGEDIARNINDIKKLTETKNDILKATLMMAKDNGISVNHSNNKSKGAGTLSGIIKSLQEKDVRESDINLFDIETLGGIKQVADISNRSILDQLMFDENSYTDMIKEQKQLIEEYRSRSEKTEEELRVLKVKLKDMEKQ